MFNFRKKKEDSCNQVDQYRSDEREYECDEWDYCDITVINCKKLETDMREHTINEDEELNWGLKLDSEANEFAHRCVKNGVSGEFIFTIPAMGTIDHRDCKFQFTLDFSRVSKGEDVQLYYHGCS